jgi:hypothetical protein
MFPNMVTFVIDNPVAPPTTPMSSTNYLAAASTSTDVVEAVPFHGAAALVTIDGAQANTEQMSQVRDSGSAIWWAFLRHRGPDDVETPSCPQGRKVVARPANKSQGVA